MSAYSKTVSEVPSKVLERAVSFLGVRMPSWATGIWPRVQDVHWDRLPHSPTIGRREIDLRIRITSVS